MSGVIDTVKAKITGRMNEKIIALKLGLKTSIRTTTPIK